MTERELTQTRLTPVIERLRQLGVEVPEIPQGEGNEFNDQYQVITNDIFEWQKKIAKLWKETVKRGS